MVVQENKPKSSKDYYNGLNKKIDVFQTPQGKKNYLENLLKKDTLIEQKSRLLLGAIYEVLGDLYSLNYEWTDRDHSVSIYYKKAFDLKGHLDGDFANAFYLASLNYAVKDKNLASAVKGADKLNPNKINSPENLKVLAEEYERDGQSDKAMNIYRKIKRLSKN